MMATTLLGTLIDMHTYCRPKGSKAEHDFLLRYVAPLPGIMRDQHGNWIVQIGDHPSILWSCHTDTVHRRSGRQTLHYNGATGVLGLSRRSKRWGINCLGADDTAGVFIAREMILRGIPGLYVLHFGEESGGIGSRALAEDYPAAFDHVQAAIALDRRGTSDVITHQWTGRTASDAFAKSVAAELSRVTRGSLEYEPSPGIYTDTAEYADLIPECSNLSVGYSREHSSDETLNTYHVFDLLDALCEVNPSAFTIERDPTAWEDDDPKWYGDYMHDRAIVLKWPDDDDDLLVPRDEDSIYLDPETERVQRWLREDLIARFNKSKVTM